MSPLVLITYRNRPVHLDVLVLYLNRYFPQLRLAVIEQVDNGPWNKGALYNIGYRELAETHDYLILHDVDWVPAKNVDYSYCTIPTMIGAQASQFNYHLCYPQFFGGVIVMSKEHYTEANGLSNLFTGYGGEDDNFRNRLISKGIDTGIKQGRFECFAHPKPDIRPGTMFFNTSEYQHNLALAIAPPDYSEGLSTVQYNIISRKDTPECIHLRVNINGQQGN